MVKSEKIIGNFLDADFLINFIDKIDKSKEFNNIDFEKLLFLFSLRWAKIPDNAVEKFKIFLNNNINNINLNQHLILKDRQKATLLSYVSNIKLDNNIYINLLNKIKKNSEIIFYKTHLIPIRNKMQSLILLNICKTKFRNLKTNFNISELLEETKKLFKNDQFKIEKTISETTKLLEKDSSQIDIVIKTNKVLEI